MYSSSLADDKAVRVRFYEQSLAEWHAQHHISPPHLTAAAIARCALCDEDGYRDGRVCDHVDHTTTHAAGMKRVRAALAKDRSPEHASDTERTNTMSPVITLIGGPARVGKTTLACRFAADGPPMELIHLDRLLHAACAVAGPEAVAALHKAPSINTHTPPQWLRELRERDLVLWRTARACVTAANGQPLVAEGGLWPDWVSELEQDHDAIFIVDTGDSAQRLVEITHANPQSWMAQRRWSDDKIRRWAEYNHTTAFAVK